MEDTKAEKEKGKIVRVAGPLVVATYTGEEPRMYDVALVGQLRLAGEIIRIDSTQRIVSTQVYERTEGLKPDDPVYLTHQPFRVELGPGLVGNTFDGIQRPLPLLPSFLERGALIPALDRERKWRFMPVRKESEEVEGGDVIGVVQETPLVLHKIMIPPGVRGTILGIDEGEFTVEDVVCRLATSDGSKIELTLMQRWPVRTPRPCRERLSPNEVLVTGQRVCDTFFPVAKGGTVCVPGPFGAGKTVIQHQIAKYADADVIVFIGCGERGNEMADVLLGFPELRDPKTGEPLMKRTILVANTSDMPVAAREASVYTGVTIAEYYRDMGYSVVLQADSTSRWAEAMREISCRLEEMPGDEGYPPYLGQRVAEFYERAGRVKCIGGSNGRLGDVTIIGSVSPPGGDPSDPVVQATLRVVKVFWSLEDVLAQKRHFPAISWLNSYSLYIDDVRHSFERIFPEFSKWQKLAMAILKKEAELTETIRVIGKDAISPEDRLVLEIARMLREDLLYQSAFDTADSYSSLDRQCWMLSVIMLFRDIALKNLSGGTISISDIETHPLRADIARMRFSDTNAFQGLKQKIEREL